MPYLMGHLRKAVAPLNAERTPLSFAFCLLSTPTPKIQELQSTYLPTLQY